MLDWLTVLQPEDVHHGLAAGARFSHHVDVQNDIIAFREYTNDLAVRLRISQLERRNELSKAIRAICNTGVVLRVCPPHHGDGGFCILVVQRFVIESDDGRLVLLKLCGVRRFGCATVNPDRNSSETTTLDATDWSAEASRVVKSLLAREGVT